MTLALPTTIDGFDIGRWETYEPWFNELQSREVDDSSRAQWLADWSHITRFFREAMAWSYIQKTLDTMNPETEKAYLDVVRNVQPEFAKADQVLKERLLALDVDEPDMAIVLRNLRDEVDLFRESNLPLAIEETQLSTAYDKIAGSLSAEYNGETQNLSQLGTHLSSKDRAEREHAWRTIMALWQSARDNINSIYVDELKVRAAIAKNADCDNYRTYAFRQRRRFSYTPEDCTTFHDAIENAFVPAAQRVLERKRAALGYDALRPWEWIPEMSKIVEPGDEAALKPFATEDELVAGSLRIFNKLDDTLGRDFATMADEGLLDLMTRQGKAMGGYCYSLSLRQQPFIFMNSVGSSANIRTLLHEAGHAFHGFAAMKDQPLVWQQRAPMEFNEVASMAMELLAAPYLTTDQGGFYSESEAARSRIEHLEKIILFLPYMAVVDKFQHWVYTNIEAAQDPANLDAKYDELCQRFLGGIDWTGLEHIRESGWHRKLHIFRYPFYYIEYGMAQMGALQVWRNSMNDHAKALADYRHALSLGGTKTLPELFEAAGAEFRFDTPFTQGLVDLLESELDKLYAAQ